MLSESESFVPESESESLMLESELESMLSEPESFVPESESLMLESESESRLSESESFVHESESKPESMLFETVHTSGITSFLYPGQYPKLPLMITYYNVKT